MVRSSHSWCLRQGFVRSILDAAVPVHIRDSVLLSHLTGPVSYKSAPTSVLPFSRQPFLLPRQHCCRANRQSRLLTSWVAKLPFCSLLASMCALEPDPQELPPLPDLVDQEMHNRVFTHRSLYARPTHVFEDSPQDPSPDNEMCVLLRLCIGLDCAILINRAG